MPKISNLQEITSPADDDELAIVDTSATETKRFLLSTLVTYVKTALQAVTSWIDSSMINFGGAGSGIWWEEIARTTVTTNVSTITVSNIPQRKYLKVILVGLASGGTLNANITFNNDTGSNYTCKYNVAFGGAETSLTSTTSFPVESGATDNGSPSITYLDILNVETYEKLFRWQNNSADASGAATGTVMVDGQGKWANTSTVINRIDMNNAGAYYGAGSEIIVLGHD